MEEKLLILMLENKASDAETTNRILNKAGIKFTSKRVGTRESFIKAIEYFPPDIILAENNLPSFDGLSALEIAKQKCPGVPVIFVTVALNEEFAVEILKNGAADYIVKDRLWRLAPVIKRVLREVEIKRKEKAELEKLHFISEYYKSIINSSLDMIIAVDNERKITEFNAAAQKVFGYNREEIIGKHVNILYKNPEDGFKIQQEANVEIAENKIKSGRIFLSSISSSILRDASGKMIGIMGVSRDITESKQKEDELKRSESQKADELKRSESMLKAMLDNIPDITCLKDQESRFIAANEAFCKSCGVELKNLIGKTDLDIWPKELAERYRADDREVIMSGNVKSVEEPLADKEGKMLWVHTVKTPVFNEDGKIAGITGISRDITERKKAEEKMKASEIRYRRFFESAKDAILIIDAETGKIIDANPFMFDMLGYSSDYFLGKELWQISPLNEIIQNKEKFSQLQKEKYIRYENLPLKTQSGRLVYVEFVSNIYMVDGAKIIQCNIRDITERWKAEEQIKIVKERFRELFDNMSNGIAVYEAKPGGNDFVFKEFNCYAEKIDKIKKEQVIGKSITEISPGIEKCGVLDALKSVWQTGKPEYLEEFFYEDARVSGWRDSYIYKLPSEEIVAIYEDTTNRKHKYDSQAVIKLLLNLTMEDITRDEFLSRTLDLIFSLHRFSFEKKGAIFLKEENNDVLVMTVNRGISEPLQKTCSKVKFGKCLCGLAASTKKIVFIDSIDKQHEIRYEGIKPHGHYCVPILSSGQGQVIGVMNIYVKEGYKSNREEEEFFTVIANTIAGVVERKRGEEKSRNSYDKLCRTLDETSAVLSSARAATSAALSSAGKLRKTLEETSAALSSALEKREHYTKDHQNRVSKLACAIAKELGLPEEQIEGLRIGCILHDIGKLNIPTEILDKPGKLTDLEYAFIKTHAQSGFEILKEIEFPWSIAQMVFQHHERINGSGYPQCLSGKDILLESKIMSVADVVEAMVSNRPYRAALGIDKALLEIRQNKGIIYDAGVVDACLKVFDSKKFKFQ